jgi:hypothetical protein
VWPICRRCCAGCDVLIVPNRDWDDRARSPRSPAKLLTLSTYTGDAERTGSVALRAMCGSCQQIGLTTVACRVIAVPVATVAEADSTATGCAVRSGIGNDARWGGAASAVFRIVVDVDFAAVVGEAVTVPITSQTARNGAEPVAPAGRRCLGKRAGNAGVSCASGLRLCLGYALVATELLLGGTFPILQIVEVDAERTSGKGR